MISHDRPLFLLLGLLALACGSVKPVGDGGPVSDAADGSPDGIGARADAAYAGGDAPDASNDDADTRRDAVDSSVDATHPGSDAADAAADGTHAGSDAADAAGDTSRADSGSDGVLDAIADRPDAMLPACTTDVQDCNHDPADGCEAMLLSDPMNCGRCGNRCAAPNGAAACVGGLCAPLTCAAGFGDCNGNRVDGCEQRLDTDLRCGSCDIKCASPAAWCSVEGGTARCLNPAASLQDQRLENACVAPDTSDELCGAIAASATCPAQGRVVVRTLTLGGSPGVGYDVTLRFRGVLEPKIYSGGRGPGDHFYIGGQPTKTNYNVYRLGVSSPKQDYFLNYDEAEGETHRVFAIDYSQTIRMNGGATVTLELDDLDCTLVRNCRAFGSAVCQPYVVAGVPPAPNAFDGQFVHIEVVLVVPGT